LSIYLYVANQEVLPFGWFKDTKVTLKVYKVADDFRLDKAGNPAQPFGTDTDAETLEAIETDMESKKRRRRRKKSGSEEKGDDDDDTSGGGGAVAAGASADTTPPPPPPSSTLPGSIGNPYIFTFQRRYQHLLDEDGL
jgi:hypothetical protein